MIVNTQNLQDLFVEYNAAFREGFGVAPSDWEMVSLQVPSTTEENHYAWLGQFPEFEEWVGDRTINDLKAYDYRIKNRKYQTAIGVKREQIEDDQYGIFSPLFTNMGQAARSHPSKLVFPLIKAGFATACYDGQYFFDTDHPVGREGAVTSVSNLLPDDSSGTQPWYLLDLSSSLRPVIFQKRREYAFRSVIDLNDSRVFETDEFRFGVDARVNVGFGLWQKAFGSKSALTPDNFNAAYAAMQEFKSDEGRPLGNTPTHLLVHPSLRATAKQIVRERDNYGADNVNFDLVKVMVSPWLA